MATKRISVQWQPGGVLTDADSVTFNDAGGTYGVRRKDDLTSVLPAGTALTHDGVGLYSATLTGLIDGVEYEYNVEVVDGAITERGYSDFVAGAVTGFGSLAEMDRIRGEINRRIGGNKDSSVAPGEESAESLASAAASLETSNADIQLAWDFRLNSLGASLSTLAGLSIPSHLRTWLDRTASMGAVYFNDEGRGFSGDSGDSYKGQLRELYNDYQERLRQIRDGEILMAIEVAEEIEQPAGAGEFEFVDITRVGPLTRTAADENARPMYFY